MAFLHSHRLFEKLVEAGVLPDSQDVRKVSIVLEVGGAVTIYIERYADKDALERAVPEFKGAQVVEV